MLIAGPASMCFTWLLLTSLLLLLIVCQFVLCVGLCFVLALFPWKTVPLIDPFSLLTLACEFFFRPAACGVHPVLWCFCHKARHLHSNSQGPKGALEPSAFICGTKSFLKVKRKFTFLIRRTADGGVKYPFKLLTVS